MFEVHAANRQCHCKDPAAHAGTSLILRPCSSNPFFDMRLCYTHVCVCVCCGRAIMPCLTQSTSITCCNPEQHLQDNVKSTASSSPPCKPSMCICLHIATPLLNCACIAQHRHHYCKISCISTVMQLCFHCFPSETICSCHCHA